LTFGNTLMGLVRDRIRTDHEDDKNFQIPEDFIYTLDSTEPDLMLAVAAINAHGKIPQSKFISSGTSRRF
jgi:hypothetical protein